MFDNFVIGLDEQDDPCRLPSGRQLAGAILQSSIYLWRWSDWARPTCLQAIGNHVLRHLPHLTVGYLPAEQFCERVCRGQSGGTSVTRSKGRYRCVGRSADRRTCTSWRGRPPHRRSSSTPLTRSTMPASRSLISSDRPAQGHPDHRRPAAVAFSSGGLITGSRQAGIRDAFWRFSGRNAKRAATMSRNKILELIAQRIDSSIRELEGRASETLVRERSGQA